MKSAVRIYENGSGPKIENQRLTVMDVFYYLRRGYDFEFIHRAMPSLTRDEFDAVVEYVNEHRDELTDMDDQVEERNRREMAEQEAKGIRRPIDLSKPLERRIEELRVAMLKHKARHAEKNGAHTSH
jgi:uncharacterized protein (DUF433 family)